MRKDIAKHVQRGESGGAEPEKPFETGEDAQNNCAERAKTERTERAGKTGESNAARSPQQFFADGLKEYGGIGCEKNVKKAKQLLERALAGGEKKSLYYLGLCALAGGEKRNRQAERYFRRAAANGDADALYRWGTLCLSDKLPRYKRAAAIFAKGERVGQPDCLYQYALCLQRGRGVKKNGERAVELFERGANKGDARCMAAAARAYYEGKGAAKDEQKAERYAAAAYAQSNADAAALLAQMRLDKGDAAQAAALCVQAASAENAQGLYLLAQLYYDGTLFKRDVKKAAAFAERSAALGCGGAAAFMGALYSRGEGVILDYAKARDCYILAARMGEDCKQDAARMARYLRRAKVGYADYYSQPLKYEKAGFRIQDDALISYNGGGVCAVPEGVKVIKTGAMSGQIRKVIFPSSLVKVEQGAFHKATVKEFAAPRDCLAVRIENGRALDRKGRPLC